MACVNLQCERVRSERFAQGCFSFSKKKSISEPDAQSNTLHQAENSESLSERCILIREVSDWTLAVSEKMAVQLFQDCLGETVQRTVILNATTKNAQKAMVVEFRSMSSVDRILSAFDSATSSLKLPSPIPDLSARAGNSPKLEEEFKQEKALEPKDESIANKRRGGQQNSNTRSKGTSSSSTNYHLPGKSTEQKPSTSRDRKQSRNGGRKKENKTASRQEDGGRLANTDICKEGNPKEDEENGKSDIEEKVEAMYAVIMEKEEKAILDVELLRRQLEEKDALLTQQRKEASESKTISNRKLSEKGRLLADLRKELAKKDAIIAQLKQTEEELASHLSAQEKKISRLTEEHTAECKAKEETHKKVCLQYQNQLSDLKRQLEDMTMRVQQQREPDNSILKMELSTTQEKVKELEQQLQQKNKTPKEKGPEILEVPSVLSWAQMNTSSTSIMNSSDPCIQGQTNDLELGTLVGFDSAVFAGTIPTFCPDNLAIREKSKSVGMTPHEKPDAHSLENKSARVLKPYNGTERQRENEWEILQSMYGCTEIKKSDDGKIIYRSLQLPLDATSTKHMSVELRLIMPDGYPGNPDSLIEVDVSLTTQQESSYSEACSKLVLESLPKLLATCRCEAKSYPGQEVMLAILISAETWIQNDWKEIMAKNAALAGQIEVV